MSEEQSRYYAVDITPDWGETWDSFRLTMNDIVEIDVQQSCFLKSQPSDNNVIPITVGQANSGETTITYLASAGEAHKTGLARVWYGRKSGNSIAYNDIGTFRIDRVTKNQENGTITVHGFDKLSDTDLYTVYDLYQLNLVSATATDLQIINAICTLLNFTADQSISDSITNGYTISASTSDAWCREMLTQIAAAYGGAFFIVNTTLFFTDLLIAPESNLLMAAPNPNVPGLIKTLTIGGDHIIVHAY